MDYTYLDIAIADTPGASVDKELLEELKSNSQLSASKQTGASTFAGSSGQAITITETDDTDYFVSITPNADPGGNLGEVWVVNDSTTQFTVYNSGSAKTAFSWVVIE